MKQIIASLKVQLESIDKEISAIERNRIYCDEKAIHYLRSETRPKDEAIAERNYRYWATKERELYSSLCYLRIARSEVFHSIENMTKADERVLAYQKVEKEEITL